MQITILSQYFSPFSTGQSSETVARLAADFVKETHDISVIMPRPVTLIDDDLEQFSLARRLMTINVKAGDQDVKFGRFDGRTSSGVNTFLLDSAKDPSNYTPAMLGSAALQLQQNNGSKTDAIIVIDNTFNITSDVDNSVKKLLFITQPKINFDNLDSYDTVVILGRQLARQLEDGDNDVIRQLILTGKAITLPALPGASIISDTTDTADKASAKAACQFNFGLPVKNVPLLFVDLVTGSDFTNQLKKIINRDIQIIATAPVAANLTDDVQTLISNYPDRLTILPRETDISTILPACDFAICNSNLTPDQCMSAGVVPIATAESAGNIIDIDPSVQSGNGLRYDENTGRTLNGAVGNALSIYAQIPNFAHLCAALPSFATSRQQLFQNLEMILSANS